MESFVTFYPDREFRFNSNLIQKMRSSFERFVSNVKKFGDIFQLLYELAGDDIVGVCSLLDTSPRSQQSGAIQLFADCLHMETDLLQLFVLQYFPSIENVRRFDHLLVNRVVVELLYAEVRIKVVLNIIVTTQSCGSKHFHSYHKFIPFSAQHNSVRVFNRIVRIRVYFNRFANVFGFVGDRRMSEVAHDLLTVDFRIVDVQFGTFFQQCLAHGECGRFACVAGVLLECESEDRDAFVGHSVEQTLDDLLRETHLLVFIHIDDLLPVRGHLGQIQTLTDVHQIKNVFLEAAAAKSDRRLQEFRTDA